MSSMLLGALSCSSLRKVGECKRMVDTVNGSLSRLATSAADAGANPVTYLQLAEGYQALAKELESASSSDEALNKTIGSYRELIQRAAKQSREFSEELDRPTSTPEEEREQEARLARLRAQAKNDVSREASLVRKLNGLCQTQ
jgi:vacuolar-type H+-ATPase subunit I/STV1